MANIEYEIKGNYGQRWEVVTSEGTRAEALQRLHEYNENEPQYAHKITRHIIKKESK